MKLYNVILIADCYVVAESGEAAREALKTAILEGEKHTEETALEVRNETSIREAKKADKPFVGADVSDADFEKLKGKTTVEIYKLIYTKVSK